MVDVGSGSCSIAQLPGDEGIVIFDAGYWRGKRCIQALDALIGNKKIALIVLSHSDADHIGDAASILANYKVETILRTGVKRNSKTWRDFDQAVRKAERTGTKVYDASQSSLPGLEFSFGEASITIIYGKQRWDGEHLSSSEARNAVSIVAKLEYAGRAVLFPGDAVGRKPGAANDSCSYSEKEMVLNNAVLSLDADILLAPHHGSDSSSSSCFIKAVSPEYVIFQSGHRYGHPSLSAKKRYTQHGVPISHIFRTDFKDAEDSPYDWEDSRYEACKDLPGDDDIGITITNKGEPLVEYRTPERDNCSL
ncbi:hypothetical protein GCM10011357_19830 [Lacimicrobium alkaliphilum]|uniref:Metallo-beta-lactamase domain-containing protein n=1 Tax=Lacimicrobium alkaliphilum TaxID=1526571 RepID=A0ABQ1RB35_9ALTE|nr:hypothetical protein GCM10011357_19830 [Lacimicrobium alkaliphilum]